MFLKKFAQLLPLCAVLLQTIGGISPLNATTQIPSKLFGLHGEDFVVGGRLPDFSYAGYHRGEVAIPDRMPDVSVTTFGAKGDGVTDDSAAFQKAIDASRGKVIFIPPGNYIINNQLRILGHTGTVLKGAGRGVTTLTFPRPLEQIFPGTNTPPAGSKYGLYHGYGGVILVGGRNDLKAQFPQKSIATVTANASQGSNTLTVSNGALFHPGQDYVIAMGSSNKALPSYLLGGNLDKFTISPSLVQANFCIRVVSVSGNVVTIDRPLPFEISTSWRSTIYPAETGSTECGIEDLSIYFPRLKYSEPATEPGYNAILFLYTHNSYVRRIHIQNSDTGITCRGGYNNHFDDLTFGAIGSPSAQTGHFAILFDYAFDNVASNIILNSTFAHAFCMYSAHLNVVKNAFGQNGGTISLDHRGKAPTRNLFSNIFATNVYSASGNAATEGLKAGEYETYWNVQRISKNWPSNFGTAQKNIVGAYRGTTSYGPLWYEVISGASLVPQELHSAQLSLRLSH